MEELQYQIMQILIPALTTIIGALVAAGIAYFNSWIASKTKNEKIREAMYFLSGLVSDTVAEINQSVELAYKDGKLTQDEKYKLRALAMDKIDTQIPAATRKILTTAVDTLDDYIGTLVEASVAAQKR